MNSEEKVLYEHDLEMLMDTVEIFARKYGTEDGLNIVIEDLGFGVGTYVYNESDIDVYRKNEYRKIKFYGKDRAII